VSELPDELGLERPRWLARGGMGELFLADHVGAAGGRTRVVVKRMLARHARHADYVRRFRDEARLGLQLRHGHIVRVLDYRELDGHHYIFFEAIEGPDLRQIVAASRRAELPIPQPVAAYFLHGIASALAHMADATDPEGRPLDLVHRDISPSNVLVSADGVPKLIDFGVAKASMRETRTVTGLFVGKYAYASPEQIRVGELDPRSDLFSLGIVGYELLAGQRPFRGQTDFEICRAILEDEPAPLGDQRDDLDPILEAAVLRCLRKVPEERFESPLALVRELGRYFHASVPHPPAMLVQAFLAAPALAIAEDEEPPHAATELDEEMSGAVQDSLRGAQLRRMSEDLSELEEPPPLPGPAHTTVPKPGDDTPTPPRRGWLLALAGLALGAVAMAVLGAVVLDPFGWRVEGEGPVEPVTGAEAMTEAVTATEAATEAVTATVTATEAVTEAVTGAVTGAEAATEPEGEPPTAPPIPTTGTLTVRVHPWAEVTVDGRAVGRTPVVGHELTAGPHVVRASNAQLGWSREETVQIEAGGSRTVTWRAEASGP